MTAPAVDEKNAALVAQAAEQLPRAAAGVHTATAPAADEKNAALWPGMDSAGAAAANSGALP